MNPDITLPKEIKVKQYKALLTQLGTAAPTAKVLLNTTDLTIVWSRVGAGSYFGTGPENCFPLEQTACMIQQAGGGNINVAIARGTNSIIAVTTINSNTLDGIDEVLNYTYVEILIYNTNLQQ